MSKPPSVTLIAGPTASGKSALALKMARETGAVIINADSQQLYADLRILTARPSVEDEGQADHRLYGVADAADAWSVGRWSRAVMALLDDLRAEGRPAIIVGGTGLYFLTLTRGLADIPQVLQATRDAVELDYSTAGEAAFRRRLAEFDPTSANRIERGDRQRLVRAMSVMIASGRSLTDWKTHTQPLLSANSWTALLTDPDRTQLYQQCDARVEKMIGGGALEEVQNLLDRRLSKSLPAMKAVGVRELSQHLNGETTLAEAMSAMKIATRNYAKRQLTWFRNQCPDWPKA